jgi:hypothetical protein
LGYSVRPWIDIEDVFCNGHFSKTKTVHIEVGTTMLPIKEAGVSATYFAGACMMLGGVLEKFVESV